MSSLMYIARGIVVRTTVSLKQHRSELLCLELRYYLTFLISFDNLENTCYFCGLHKTVGKCNVIPFVQHTFAVAGNIKALIFIRCFSLISRQILLQNTHFFRFC
jgi:hypothetical protein